MSDDSLMNENENQLMNCQDQSMKSSRINNLDEHIKLVKQKKEEVDHLRLQRIQEQLRKKEQKSYVNINNNKSSFLTIQLSKIDFFSSSIMSQHEKERKEKGKMIYFA